MARLTMSKDGRYRMDIKVSVRLGGDLLTEVLAEYVNSHGKFEKASAALLLSTVRKELARRGEEHFYFWHEGVDEEDVQASREHALGWVKKHWPGLL
jgi:hypothetical protein